MAWFSSTFTKGLFTTSKKPFFIKKSFTFCSSILISVTAFAGGIWKDVVGMLLYPITLAISSAISFKFFISFLYEGTIIVLSRIPKPSFIKYSSKDFLSLEIPKISLTLFTSNGILIGE